MLFANATNRDGGTWEWCNAASVALAEGDVGTYDSLCGVALSRFASGLEQDYIARIAVPLLLHPQDEIVMTVLDDLVRRTETTGGIATLRAPHMRAWLEYRNGHFQEAHAALDHAATIPFNTPYYGRILKYLIHADHFLRAILLAKSGRSGEAQAAFAKAAQLMGPAPSPTNPRDLGDQFQTWYQAVAARREAEQVFRLTGIAIPETP